MSAFQVYQIGMTEEGLFDMIQLHALLKVSWSYFITHCINSLGFKSFSKKYKTVKGVQEVEENTDAWLLLLSKKLEAKATCGISSF